MKKNSLDHLHPVCQTVWAAIFAATYVIDSFKKATEIAETVAQRIATEKLDYLNKLDPISRQSWISTFAATYWTIGYEESTEIADDAAYNIGRWQRGYDVKEDERTVVVDNRSGASAMTLEAVLQQMQAGNPVISFPKKNTTGFNGQGFS